MKISNIITAAAAFWMACFGGVVQALEAPVAVQAESGQEHNKAVLRHVNGRMQVEFQVKGLPSYNRYQLILGDKELAQSSDPAQSPNVKQEMEGGATWLVVVDTSDPSGRANAIIQEKQIMMRLHTFMSKVSPVAVYSLSRELKNLNAHNYLPAQGENLNYPVARPGRNGMVWAPDAEARSNAMFRDVSDAANANTYLWVGLSKVIKEELPKMATGAFAHRPKGIILLSDGVDESSSSADDLNRLVEQAHKAGVVIHTIGFPNKDRAKGGSKTALHKGFNFLQRLSVETGGTFLTYEDVAAEGEKTLRLLELVNKTETNLLQVDFPITKVMPGNNLTLRLWEGSSTLKEGLIISQYDIAKVYGDYCLHVLFNLTEAVRNEKDDEKMQAGIISLGAALMGNLQPLPIREELFKYTDVDEPFAKRVHEILKVLDKHPEMMKKVLKSLTDENAPSSSLIREVGVCLYNPGAPLPEPEKEVTDNRPIVINNTNTQSGSSSAYTAEEESIQDWVWWPLGLGGCAFAVLIFWSIVKITNRHEGGNTSGGGNNRRGGATGKPSLPALAYLVNKSNPSERWAVTSKSSQVGRHRKNDVVLPSYYNFVSSTQFILKYRDGSWELRDSNSTNGTYVNGEKANVVQLNNGDTIRIGDLEMEFRIC